jgi:hypothetical protein
MCSVSGHQLLNRRKEHFNIINYNIKILNGIIIYNTRLTIFSTNPLMHSYVIIVTHINKCNVVYRIVP